MDALTDQSHASKQDGFGGCRVEGGTMEDVDIGMPDRPIQLHELCETTGREEIQTASLKVWAPGQGDGAVLGPDGDNVLDHPDNLPQALRNGVVNPR